MQTGSPTSSQHDVIKKLLEQNKELNEQILQSSKKVEKYIFWIKVMNILKFILIIVPLALGFWLVSPYLKQVQSAFGVYGDLLGINNNNIKDSVNTKPDSTLNQLDSLLNSEEVQKLLKQQQKN